MQLRVLLNEATGKTLAAEIECRNTQCRVYIEKNREWFAQQGFPLDPALLPQIIQGTFLVHSPILPDVYPLRLSFVPAVPQQVW